MNPFDPNYIPKLAPERSTSAGVRASRKKCAEQGIGWGNGTLPGSTTKGKAPAMMRGVVKEGNRYLLPSGRVVVVGAIRGDEAECCYVDDGMAVAFDCSALETIGKRA